jgi:hypothetical protein
VITSWCRYRAALICAAAASWDWRAGLCPNYDEIAESFGVGRSPLELAGAALDRALEYTAPDTDITICDAEAEALIRDGWVP